jgi:S-adenosylmethionine hydrolase
MPIVTFMTDFGTSDHYVACMKGVVLSIAPEVQIIDITHRIERHDVVHGAFVLRQTFEFFPRGSIHVAVVDPGVGTTRRLIAGQYASQTVLAPDNGLISLIHRDFPLTDLRSIENRRLFRSSVSSTFHGRDILAPVAGHLASGVNLATIGPTAAQLEILNLPEPVVLPDGGVEGQVLYVDAFGNLTSNISRSVVDACLSRRRQAQVHVGPLRIGPIRHTYADVKTGDILALLGSSGTLEIAINQGSAAERLHAGPGTTVILR